MGRYGYGDRNEHGERLLEFATAHNLYVCNSRFQQKPSRKWTWASPDGIHKNMIDLILIQQRWKTSVINCRTFQSADISSDHSLVMCNIKLRLKKLNNRPQQSCRVDVNQLRDKKARQSYNVLLENNMEDIEPTCNLEEHATRVTEAIRSAAETLKLTDEKRRLKQLMNVSAKCAQEYRDFCKKVKKSPRQDKEHWIHDQCEQADKDLNIANTRQAYSLIKMLGKKFVPRVDVLRNQEGTMLQSKREIKQRWTQYCSGLYKDQVGGEGMVRELEEITPPNNDDSHDILYAEVEGAINILKRNKSLGSDGLTAKLLQAGGTS